MHTCSPSSVSIHGEEDKGGVSGAWGIGMPSWESSRSTAGSLELRDQGGHMATMVMPGRAGFGHDGHRSGLGAIGLQMAWNKIK